MLTFSLITNFLQEKTQLMVIVKPSKECDKALEEFFNHDIEIFNKNGAVCVPVFLEEPLNIEFSFSTKGILSKKLKKCKCITPLLPEKQLKSLNNAYQEISAKIETNRASYGGKVYDNLLFKDSDGSWKLLEVLREKVYQDCSEDIDKRIRIIKESQQTYIKPLAKDYSQFIFKNDEKDRVIKILESKTSKVEEKVQELNNLLEKSKLTNYRKKLEEFGERLNKDYPENKGCDSWQEWIYKNNWIFGIQYGTPISHPQVGFRSVLDYLFPTSDNFIDILEIKKPSHEVIKEDKSHSGAFKWSGEVNEAIGQVINYLSEIEIHQFEIVKKIKQELCLEFNAIKPRAFILIGKSDDWNDKKKEAFRRLNHSLHGIEVLTYTDLLRRGENLVKLYAD